MTIKIRYAGYSTDFSHPADRRRIGILLSDKNVEILPSRAQEFDLSILSSNSNYSKFFGQPRSKPIYIDLVDGYLAHGQNVFGDAARNLMRSAFGKSDFTSLKYTTHIKKALKKATGCIVPSEEIASQVAPFNKNIQIIADSHSEFKSIEYDDRSDGILWHGFGTNLKHLLEIAPQIDSFLELNNLRLKVVTQLNFYGFGNRFVRINSVESLVRSFPKSFKQIDFLPWSKENLIEAASKSRFAIIPIAENDAFAMAKSENKLLEMWTLGVPTITSRTHSYKRVFDSINQSENCIENSQWFNALSELGRDGVRLRYMRKIGMEYIRSCHTDEILISKWKEFLKVPL
jgi:hypothetical protein